MKNLLTNADKIIFYLGAVIVGVIAEKFGTMLGYTIKNYQFWILDVIALSIYILGFVVVYAIIQIDWKIVFEGKDENEENN